MKGLAAEEPCPILAVKCPLESSGKEAKKVDEVHGDLAKVTADMSSEGDASSSENACPHFGEEKNDLESVKVPVESVDAHANDVPGVVYCVYVLMEGTVYYSFVALGSPTEKESDASGKVSLNFECLPIVTTGGVKAKDKTGATENSSEKADNSTTGGGSVHIPAKV